MIRTYKELSRLKTFEDRFRYLKLKGEVGESTFGFDRYLNQVLYHSYEWKQLRRDVILRDGGCDLGIPEREIYTKIIIHHMNPIKESDILERSDILLNPDYLITTTHKTHNALHYGDECILRVNVLIERKPNDTIPWR